MEGIINLSIAILPNRVEGVLVFDYSDSRLKVPQGFFFSIANGNGILF
jgi:hypothetical protein